jgi:DNA modification methylase
MAKSLSEEGNTSTFIDNMSLPIHGWYRYSAGFSAKWVEETVEKHAQASDSFFDFKVLDPFAGSATTLLACDSMGIESFGYESHPLISRIATAKLSWNADAHSFSSKAKKILEAAKGMNGEIYAYPEIVAKCYDEENLKRIDGLRKALELFSDGTESHVLSWMAFVSVLRDASRAGTATWQYVLPNKAKRRVANAHEAYAKRTETMRADILFYQNSGASQRARLFRHDARETFAPLRDSIDLVVTSPPYANNYDYADATRLELSVLGEIQGWGDLQTLIRPGLIRSCSQMVSREKKDTYGFLNDPLLAPIGDEIFEVCRRLDKEKENHGGKKNYHTMIALYFLDLAKVWKNLRHACKANSDICFVIGDSAPYGVYVPVDEWLGRLAVAAGFESYAFEKIRDRNVKWKNRKHSVPLKEGKLWIKG